MTRAAAMAARLPRLYREGELLAGLLGVVGQQLEIYEEERLAVQRSHWFDATHEVDEAEALAALLDLPREPWQNLREYRAWVHALVAARLRHGAVTPQAIHELVRRYADRFQVIAGIRATPDIEEWSPDPPERSVLVENPEVARVQRVPAAGGIEPLHRFELTNRGLDPAPVSFLLVGCQAGPEFVPTLVQRTTGDALVFRGPVGPGQRLWLRSTPGGPAEAFLEGEDLSHRLVSVAGVVPGEPWDAARTETPATGLRLLPGTNRLWFLPLAHFDDAGLDRFLLALADADLRQGRFDECDFDRALFHQEPAAQLTASWVEAKPASFEVRLDAGVLRNGERRTDDALAARAELRDALDQAVQSLRPAGVEAAVRFRELASVQTQMDRLTGVQPVVHREVGTTGADRRRSAGGIFEVTEFDDSTYR